jgi:hypothetical protein
LKLKTPWRPGMRAFIKNNTWVVLVAVFAVLIAVGIAFG